MRRPRFDPLLTQVPRHHVEPPEPQILPPSDEQSQQVNPPSEYGIEPCVTTAEGEDMEGFNPLPNIEGQLEEESSEEEHTTREPEEEGCNEDTIPEPAEEGDIAGDDVGEEDEVVSSMPLDWASLYTLLSTTGTNRLTGFHYDVMKTALNQIIADSDCSQKKFVHRRTLERNLHPFARAHVFVKTCTRSFPVDMTKSGARTGVGKFQSNELAPVMMVKPSDWAKQDVATHRIYETMVGNNVSQSVDSETRPYFSSIEDAPIIRDRNFVLNSFKIRNDKQSYSAIRIGLQMAIRVKNTPLTRRRLAKAGFEVISIEKREALFKGTVRSYHISRVFQSDVDSLDRTGSPPFRVGDLVLELGSMRDVGCEETEISSTHNLYVVFRSWIRRNNGDDHRMSVIITPSTSNPQQWREEFEFHREELKGAIAEETSAHMKSGCSTEAHSPIYGSLSDGRRYLVYRFLLYTDGFTARQGNKGSMAGCYMLPLGISPDLRTSVAAIRRIGLTPPGVSTNQVLSFIIEDIVQGTTDGFSTLDPNGEEIVLFLDCVGFIADYPAISDTVDMLGHNANAPCHL